jgi:nicotinamidase/pyrazinamidase
MRLPPRWARTFSTICLLTSDNPQQIVPLINALARRFKHVVLTQDWYPPGHISFASSHPGTEPFEVIDLPYSKQVLWPDHCVQGTDGAKLHPELDINPAICRSIESAG